MSAKVQTIEEQWRQYRDSVYKGPISNLQEHETRSAFYSGFAAAFFMLSGPAVAGSEDEGCAILDGIQRHLEGHLTGLALKPKRN